MTDDDLTLLRAALIHLRRAAERATIACIRLAVELDPDLPSREVERFVADARGEVPPSDEVLRAGPSTDARAMARRRRKTEDDDR